MRKSGLDLLKAICIMLVIYTHSAQAEARAGIIFPLLIDMAVPVFMTISGYVNSASIKKKTNYYCLENLKKKLFEILIPFLLCIIIETAYLFVNGMGYSEFLSRLIFGRWGDGAYYPYILVQFILLFPIIYKFSNSTINISIILLTNIIFEYLTSIEVIPSAIHRICILRYLGFIVTGILIEKFEDKIKKRYIIGGGCAGLLICYINYKMHTHTIFAYWTTTSLPVALWAASIVCCFNKISGAYFKNFALKILENLGKHTYYIFLLQMLYYFFIEKSSINEPHCIVSMVICCALGSLLHIGIHKVKDKISKERV